LLISVATVEELKQKIALLASDFVEIQNSNSAAVKSNIENSFSNLLSFAESNQLLGIYSLTEYIQTSFSQAVFTKNRSIELIEDCLIFLMMLVERPDAESSSLMVMDCLGEDGWENPITEDERFTLADVLLEDSNKITQALSNVPESGTVASWGKVDSQTPNTPDTVADLIAKKRKITSR